MLWSLYWMFFTYALSMLFFGQTGVYSFSRLNKQLDLLVRNMEHLDDIKTELRQKMDFLRSDPVSMKIEARDMGLYEPGQTVLSFHNMKQGRVLPDAGNVLSVQNTRVVSRQNFRIFSLCIGIACFLFGFILIKVRNVSYSQS